MQRHGYVKVECIIVDHTGWEEEDYHCHIITERDGTKESFENKHNNNFWCQLRWGNIKWNSNENEPISEHQWEWQERKTSRLQGERKGDKCVLNK